MVGPAEFEIYEDMAAKLRWRLRAAPGSEPIASSEAYESKEGCKNGIKSVRTNAPNATIEDLTKG